MKSILVICAASWAEALAYFQLRYMQKRPYMALAKRAARRSD